jgi:hypothetical protein
LSVHTTGSNCGNDPECAKDNVLAQMFHKNYFNLFLR